MEEEKKRGEIALDMKFEISKQQLKGIFVASIQLSEKLQLITTIPIPY